MTRRPVARMATISALASAARPLAKPTGCVRGKSVRTSCSSRPRNDDGRNSATAPRVNAPRDGAAKVGGMRVSLIIITTTQGVR